MKMFSFIMTLDISTKNNPNQKSDNLTLLRGPNSDFEIDIGMKFFRNIFIDGIMAVISTQ